MKLYEVVVTRHNGTSAHASVFLARSKEQAEAHAAKLVLSGGWSTGAEWELSRYFPAEVLEDGGLPCVRAFQSSGVVA